MADTTQLLDELYPREVEVADAQVPELVDALLSAYPDKDFLYIRLADKWAVRVADDIVGTDGPGRVIVRRIVEYARSEGRLLDLLGLAWSDKPGNRKLKALADAWLTDQTGVIARYAPPAPPPPIFKGAGIAPAAGTEAPGLSRSALQRLVNASSKPVNLGDFFRGIDRVRHALCRICTPAVAGTGFLIGRRTVLTNFHVVENAVKQQRAGADIVCEFDFFERNSVPVRRFGLGGTGWLGPCKHYSQSDLTGVGVPGPDELDFAIIHLDRPVEPDRVALELPFTPPIIGMHDFVYIAQHPDGEEAQLAVGQVVDIPGSGLRYRYDVTTEPGSSGSPVLDFALRLVGLHHAADPGTNPRFNQGIPISRIRRALIDAAFDFGAM